MSQAKAGSGVPVLLKWGKERLEGTLGIEPGVTSYDEFKAQVFALTGVLPAQQKLLPGKEAKQSWKGPLPSGDEFFHPKLKLKTKKKFLTVTLIGTAGDAKQVLLDASTAAAASGGVKFSEDITEEEAERIEAEEIAAAIATAEGMIPALQLPPHRGARDDGKAVTYRYNYFVTGLPQRRIEAMLQMQREECRIVGEEVAMSMGTDVGKAFVVNLACLDDGTLVSGMDNGKLNLWRHGQRMREIFHGGMSLLQGNGNPSPVNCVAAIRGLSVAAFASGAHGSLKLWDKDGDMLQALVGPSGTTPWIVASCTDYDNHVAQLAVVFRQAVPFDPNEFRLPPQNPMQQARRDAAIAERERQMLHFARVESQVRILTVQDTGAAWTSTLLPQHHNSLVGASASNYQVTALAWLKDDEHTSVGTTVVVADVAGHIRQWRLIPSLNGMQVPQASSGIALTCEDGASALIPIKMEALYTKAGYVAVSTAGASSHGYNSSRLDQNLTSIQVPAEFSRSVLVLDLRTSGGQLVSIISGHPTDVVSCLLAAPDGTLWTGGGKTDAKVKVWQQSQWDNNSVGESNEIVREAGGKEGTENDDGGVKILRPEDGRTLSKPGYSFDFAVLPDLKPGSELYAVAAARYNTVKIVL